MKHPDTRVLQAPETLGLATREAFRQDANALLDEMSEGAGHLVIAAGAWTNSLLGNLGIQWPLTVTQEQVRPAQALEGHPDPFRLHPLRGSPRRDPSP